MSIACDFECFSRAIFKSDFKSDFKDQFYDLHDAISVEVGDTLHKSDNLLNHRLDDVEENT